MIMSEFLHVLPIFLNLLNLVFIGLFIPFIKHLIDLRVKIERIEVILNIIMKDVEQLKKEVYDNGESYKD